MQSINLYRKLLEIYPLHIYKVIDRKQNPFISISVNNISRLLNTTDLALISALANGDIVIRNKGGNFAILDIYGSEEEIEETARRLKMDLVEKQVHLAEITKHQPNYIPTPKLTPRRQRSPRRRARRAGGQ